MPRDTVLTPQGLEDLKARIEHLRGDRRREVAERIKEAREFGDISENAEYDDAKNEQAMLEHKIAQLEERLLNARVIQKRDVDLSVVSIGAKVKLRDVDAKRTDEYFIVGSAEANPAELKLSNESPVGPSTATTASVPSIPASMNGVRTQCRPLTELISARMPSRRVTQSEPASGITVTALLEVPVVVSLPASRNSTRDRLPVVI